MKVSKNTEANKAEFDKWVEQMPKCANQVSLVITWADFDEDDELVDATNRTIVYRDGINLQQSAAITEKHIWNLQRDFVERAKEFQSE